MKPSTQVWLWQGAVSVLVLALVTTIVAQHRGLGVAERAAPIIQGDSMKPDVETVWTVNSKGQPEHYTVHVVPSPAPGPDPRVCASEWRLQRSVASANRSIKATDMILYKHLQATTIYAAKQLTVGTDELTQVCGPDRGEP